MQQDSAIIVGGFIEYSYFLFNPILYKMLIFEENLFVSSAFSY